MAIPSRDDSIAARPDSGGDGNGGRRWRAEMPQEFRPLDRLEQHHVGAGGPGTRHAGLIVAGDDDHAWPAFGGGDDLENQHFSRNVGVLDQQDPLTFEARPVPVLLHDPVVRRALALDPCRRAVVY